MAHMIKHESYEATRSRYVTLVTENSQYDLVINYTSHFLGKVLIMHIQTNRFGILDIHDIRDPAVFSDTLGLTHPEDVIELSHYLEEVMPMNFTPTQY